MLRRLISRCWGVLWPLGILLNRCWLSLFWIALTALLLRTPQAQDLLLGFLESSWEWLWLALIALGWSILIEYCTRALIFWPYPADVSVGAHSSLYRLLPAFVGLVALFMVLGETVLAIPHGHQQTEISYTLTQRWLFCFAVIVAYTLVDGPFRVAAYLVRCLPMLANDWEVRAASQPRRQAAFIATAGGCTLIAIAFVPIHVGLSIGSIATFFLCISFWMVLTTSLAVIWRRSTPGAIVPLGRFFFSLIAFEFCVLFVAAQFAPSGEQWARQVGALPLGSVPTDIMTDRSYVRNWLQARVNSGAIQAGAKTRYPVFLVAAAGGGARAAYWSAQVLARLEKSDPNFSDHVMVMSGVSGGALGLAVFSSVLQQQRDEQQAGLVQPSAPCLRSDPANGIARCASDILGQDFLAPIIAEMLTWDAMATVVPGLDAARGDILRRSLAEAVKCALGRDTFSHPFSDLWTNDPSYRQPALFLTSTEVESGMRVIASNLNVTASDFYQAWDRQLDQVEPLTLGEAVVDSARFPFISPTGRLNSPGLGVWGHLVDGGYVDNSGGLALDELLVALMGAAKQMNLVGSIAPLVIYIENDVGNHGSYDFPVFGRDAFPPHGLFVELIAPLATLDAVRSFHANNTLYRLKQNVRANHGELYEIPLLAKEVPIPLGWTLSTEVRRYIDRYITEPHAIGFGEVMSQLSPK